jgi:hypothetical protein
MSRFSPSLSSYPETLPSELLAEVLLKLPPKDILFLCFQIKDFKRVCSQDSFWERVWLKWVSPRLPEFRDRTIRETISELVEKAKGRTPEDLLIQGSKEGILFYVLEAIERGANISANNNEAYWMALHYGQSHVVNYLISLGVDPRGLYH